MNINLLYWHNFSLHVNWPHFDMTFLFMSTCKLNCYGLYFPLPSLHWLFFHFKILISNLSNKCTLIVNEVVSHSTKIVVGGLMVWETWQINKQPSIIKILIMFLTYFQICIAKFSSYFDLKNTISISTKDFMEQMFQICCRFQIIFFQITKFMISSNRWSRI